MFSILIEKFDYIMKLRSGKILLPPVIEESLQINLKRMHTLLIKEKDFAQELAKIIACAINPEPIYEISRMIRSTFYNSNEAELLGLACSALIMLVTGDGSIYLENNIQFEFGDIIQERILKDFDIDSSFLIEAANQSDNDSEISLTGISTQIENSSIEM